ncbi:hypothetical protein J3F84DRAFT_399976 [Trichoderma pleuroticola]
MEHFNNVGYNDQNNEGQISIIREDDEISISDTQSISLSDLSDEQFAMDSETALDSDEESNSEGESHALDELLEEEEEEPSVINNNPAWIDETERLLDSNLDNYSSLRAVFSIISSDMAELWAFGKVKIQKIQDGWPQFNAQLQQIHIREYGPGFCTPEIHQGARQLLGVGGTIHYMQASIEALNNSEIEQRRIRVPTGFHFDYGTNQMLSPLNDHGKDWIVKV